MDGLDFCRWLRTQPGGDLPLVMVVTAHVAPTDLENVLHAGADEYLAKPLDLQTLNIRLAIAENRARDRTKRFQAERERERYWHRLEQAQRVESLGVLAAGIAHDFNNILAGILGNASLARMEAADDSELHSNLTQIEALSLRAAELCKQMMAYSGKVRPALRLLDLNKLVEDTVSAWERVTPQPRPVEVHTTKNLPALLGDQSQIEQALRALLNNASEAVQDNGGGVFVRTAIDHPTSSDFMAAHLSPELPECEYALLEVLDGGYGMSDEVRRRAFDPFFSTKFAGRGLGLAALAGIVRTHKGAVAVMSQPGRGATFRVWLPLSTSTPETATTTEPPASTARVGDHTSPAQPKAPRALVADDENTVRSVACRILTSRGYDVVGARDGREALEMFTPTPGEWDLVLLDLSMPRMDGAEVCKRIRAIRPDVRIVLMSGYPENEAMNRFEGGGFDAFLVKPFTVESLCAKVLPT